MVRVSASPNQPNSSELEKINMTTQSQDIEVTPEDSSVESFVNAEYEHGFVTDIDTDTVAPGLNEDVIRLISEKKEEPEWLLEWRLGAYRHW